MRYQEARGRIPLKGRRAGQHLVKHDAERVDVAARINRALFALIWRHIARRADNDVLAGQRDAAIQVLANLSDAEVNDLDPVRVAVITDDDVVGLDVAMNDAHGVRGVERATDLSEDVGGAVERQRSLLPYQLAERDAVDILHDDERRIAFANAIIHHVDGVGMMDTRGGARLLLEALAERRVGGEKWLENLDGDLLAHLRVSSAIHITHAASAEQFFEAILVFESSADERPAVVCCQIHRFVIRAHLTPHYSVSSHTQGNLRFSIFLAGDALRASDFGFSDFVYA